MSDQFLCYGRYGDPHGLSGFGRQIVGERSINGRWREPADIAKEDEAFRATCRPADKPSLRGPPEPVKLQWEDLNQEERDCQGITPEGRALWEDYILRVKPHSDAARNITFQRVAMGVVPNASRSLGIVNVNPVTGGFVECRVLGAMEVSDDGQRGTADAGHSPSSDPVQGGETGVKGAGEQVAYTPTAEPDARGGGDDLPGRRRAGGKGKASAAAGAKDRPTTGGDRTRAGTTRAANRRGDRSPVSRGGKAAGGRPKKKDDPKAV